jgi:hypothetical protein
MVNNKRSEVVVMTTVTGSCLCKKVNYEITDNIGIFQYCHCSRCRKFTGSAHASNLFVSQEHFKWISGEELVGRYEPKDTRYYATCFCKNCGSSLPWISKVGNTVVVPAGTLDQDPGLRPKWNIFYASKAPWYTESSDLPHFDELPPKKK